MKEVHLFILWENAREKQQEILEDINKNFKVIGLYNITWSKEKFSSNLSRFYGTNLPKNSGKEQHCGNGDFLLVIVEVQNPVYEERETSKGIQIVNTNMFDKKTYYRELTGGGHKVHATNSETETNHDLTLLIGKNIEDYIKNRKETTEIINIKRDLIGVNGFNTVNEMFYTLNNCINYAIIRNYETLPDEIYINEHNDIDIICDSKENAAYILNGEKVFEEDYRVHYKVKVEDKTAFFDLRYLGDNYYCYEMEKELLEKRIYNKKGFYTISEEEYFYSLMYHAILHKPKFANDYKERLQKMNSTSMQLEKEEDFINALNDWLLFKNYPIVKPYDLSVQFNTGNAKKFNNTFDPEMYKRSDLRKNIVHWYPMKENSDVLQIGYDSEKLIEELCSKSNKLTVIVKNKEQEEEILRLIKCKKLKVEILTDFKIKEDKKYDYVTLIGTVEDYEGIIKGNAINILEQVLKFGKNKCKEDGKILLAIDNKLGMKFWTSLKVQNNILCNEDIAISKKDINDIFKKLGITNYKYFYPLPDYKMTNVIFTDECLPTVEHIKRNFTYGEEEFSSFNQTEAFEQIINNDKDNFGFFANSYFIEISNSKIENEDIKFVSYTNIRKDSYKIQTIIYEDRVEKTFLSEKSKEHIEDIKRNIDIMNDQNIKTLDSYQDEKIISKYFKEAKSYDKVLLEMLKDNKNDEFFNAIEEYKNLLLKKLQKIENAKDRNVFKKYNIEIPPELLEELTFVKNGLYDMIFENVFLIENELYFYDQEWYEENIPVEFIIYRCIAYFPGAHSYIPSNELYKTLKLEKYINVFKKLDMELQHKIRDEKIWKIHNNVKTGQTLIDLYKNLKNEFEEYKMVHDNENKNNLKEIQELRNNLGLVGAEHEKLLNSKSWKWTKPMRWIIRNIKK